LILLIFLLIALPSHSLFSLQQKAASKEAIFQNLFGGAKNELPNDLISPLYIDGTLNGKVKVQRKGVDFLLDGTTLLQTLRGLVHKEVISKMAS
jgi:hypothetical protein